MKRLSSRWWKGAGTYCIVVGCGAQTTGRGLTGMCRPCSSHKNMTTRCNPRNHAAIKDMTDAQRRSMLNAANAAYRRYIATNPSDKASMSVLAQMGGRALARAKYIQWSYTTGGTLDLSTYNRRWLHKQAVETYRRECATPPAGVH